MKDFLKYTLATVTGIIAVSAVMMFLGIISLIGMLASEQSKPKVKDNSVFVLSLSGAMQERSEDDVFSQITGNAPAVVGLEDVLNSIQSLNRHTVGRIAVTDNGSWFAQGGSQPPG